MQLANTVGFPPFIMSYSVLGENRTSTMKKPVKLKHRISSKIKQEQIEEQTETVESSGMRHGGVAEIWQ